MVYIWLKWNSKFDIDRLQETIGFKKFQNACCLFVARIDTIHFKENVLVHLQNTIHSHTSEISWISISLRVEYFIR